MRRTNRTGTITVAIICAALVSGGCQLAGDDRAVAEYDGETLFRGILLGQGEVASLIPEIRDNYALDPRTLTKDELQATLAARDAIVAEVGEAHPAFFAEFAAAIQSGDHVQIRRGLDSGGALLVEAMDGLGMTEGTTPSTEQKCCVYVLCNVIHAILLVVDVQNRISSSAEETRLLQEQIVDSIALRLAP